MKRGGGRPTVSLDVDTAERRLGTDVADRAPTPDRLFEQRWARVVLENAMTELREECVRAGDETRFERLKPYLMDEGPADPYSRVADELAISESGVKVAVHRLRQRFGQTLREVIGRTVSNAADVDDEIRSLLTSLGA